VVGSSIVLACALMTSKLLPAQFDFGRAMSSIRQRSIRQARRHSYTRGMQGSRSSGFFSHASLRTRPLAAALLLATIGALACGEAPTSPSNATSGPPCDYRIAPILGGYAVPVEGATLVIEVHVAERCAWRFAHSANWINVPLSESRTSASRVMVVAPNEGPFRSHTVFFNGSARVGSAERVERPVVTFNQEGVDIPIPSSPTFMWFASHDEVIGMGLTRLYRPTDGEFGSFANDRRRVSVNVRARDGNTWRVILGAPTGQSLEVGRYEDVGNLPTATRGTISFETGTRVCDTPFGWFEILDLAVTSTAVARLHAKFEQRCGVPTNRSLLGEVWYVAPS
jgi:hypothetical protein